MSIEDLTPRETGGMIHPEVRAPVDESERHQDGGRLQHAEAASKPIAAPKTREPQPRGAKIRGNRPIDQGEAAERFLAAPLHQAAHDERLWDLRKKRDVSAHGIPEWEELREIASSIKAHTLSRLDTYLEQFEAAAKANGVHVHWAADGADHNRIVLEILRSHGARTLVKSKSMLTEECGFRH
ncbi:MAG: lactate utilization protein, partial [Methylobacterium sp.]